MCTCSTERLSELVASYGILQVPLPLAKEATEVVRKLGKENYEYSWLDDDDATEEETLQIERLRDSAFIDYISLDEYATDTAPLDLINSDFDLLINDLRTARLETYRLTRHMLEYRANEVIGSIISFTEIRMVAREILHATNVIKWVGLGLSHADMLKRYADSPLPEITTLPMRPLDPIERAFCFLELCSTPTFMYRIVGEDASVPQKLGEAATPKPAGNREGSLLEAISIQLQSAATNGLAWHECAWCKNLFQVKRATTKEKTDRKRTEGIVYCCERHRNAALQKAYRERKRAKEDVL